jgi:hypothetical protein
MRDDGGNVRFGSSCGDLNMRAHSSFDERIGFDLCAERVLGPEIRTETNDSELLRMDPAARLEHLKSRFTSRTGGPGADMGERRVTAW